MRPGTRPGGLIVDTSAIIAVLQDEPESAAVVEALIAATDPAISTATLVELCVVADTRRDPVRSARFDDLLAALGLRTIPFTAEHAAIARRAHLTYGRGSGHPARLNLGDCFSYALAVHRDQPLLYVGNDFSHTDIRSALGPGPESPI